MSTPDKMKFAALATPKKNQIDAELVETCKSLSMSPPAREGRYLSLGDIMHAICEDAFEDRLSSNDQIHRALVYLYGRAYFEGLYNEQRRKTEVATILANQIVLERLMTVVKSSEDIDVGFYDTYFYGNWTDPVVDWGVGDGAHTVYEEMGIEIVLRKQLSKNCFLHAPAVLHGYLVQKSTGKFHGMVDITKFVRHYFCDESFSQLIVHDDGGDSQAILDSLAPVPSVKLHPRGEDFIQDVVKNFGSCGPALVSRFEIDQSMDSFEQSDDDHLSIPFFDEYVPQSQGRRPHAMVLVGYRDNDTGDGVNFLLQNWWPSMQFLEVTGDFLKASNAHIIFLTKDVRLPDELPLTMCKVGEAQCLEGQDHSGGVHEG